MRLISSQSFQPTSPSQSSFVPGRNAKRSGFRRPYATIRRAFASADPASGLSAGAAPVSGSMRMIVPSSETGSAGVRRSWLRSAPPSAVGGASVAPMPPGGSPHGFSGLPSWP
jgi:hypothetical protein